MKHFILSFLILMGLKLSAQITLNSNQQNNWVKVGYQGNSNFNDTTVINVIEFGAVGNGKIDDQPAIQSAINSLQGRKGIIYLPPGNYRLEKSLTMRDSVVLKGTSAGATIITLDFKGMAHHGINISGSVLSTMLSIRAGFHNGSTFLVTEHDHGIEAGDYIEIKQQNGAWDVAPASWAEYSIGKIIQVKSVSSNKIFLEEALDLSFNPKLNPVFVKIKPATEIHIKCLTIKRKIQYQNTDPYNIYFRYAINSSVSGIISDKSLGSHIMIENSKYITVDKSYFNDAYEFTGNGTRGYGITLRAHAEKNLIENNVFKRLRHAMVVKEGAFHNVISYNYSIEPYRTEYPNNASGDISLHGHYAFENLFEGNIVQNIIIDHYWGPSGPKNTFFRNRTELYGIIISNGNITTSEQVFMYNEITNHSFLHGNFIILGDKHYTYGNNIKGSLEQIDKNRTVRYSKYLSQKPNWWLEKMPWPSIGYPQSLNQHSNPARERYHQQVYASCGEYSDVRYHFNNLTEFELVVRLHPNPVKEDLDIQVETENIISSDMNIKVFSMAGKLVHEEQMPVFSDISYGSIKLPATVATGTYLIRIECDGRVSTKKFFKQ